METGTELWTEADAYQSPLVVADGAVLVSRPAEGGGHTAHALELRTGRARWDAPVERGFPVGIAEDAVLFMTPPSSATVAVRTEVRAVDAATGRERWVHTIDGPSPTLWTDGQHIVLHQVGSDGDDNTVVALDPGDGQERWRSVGPGFASGLEGGTLVVSMPDDGRDGPLVGLDAATGEQRWEGVPATVASTGNNVLLMSDGLAYLQAPPLADRVIDVATGEERWHHPAPDQPIRDNPVALDGSTLVLDAEGSNDELIVVDLATGQPRTPITLPPPTDDSYVSGVAVHDGSVYVTFGTGGR